MERVTVEIVRYPINSCLSTRSLFGIIIGGHEYVYWHEPPSPVFTYGSLPLEAFKRHASSKMEFMIITGKGPHEVIEEFKDQLQRDTAIASAEEAAEVFLKTLEG